MFGLGVQELLFIFVLALLIFGPKKLPEIGRTLGRGMREFRRATTDIQRTINTEIALEEEKTTPAVTPATAPATATATATAPAEPSPESESQPPSSE